MDRNWFQMLPTIREDNGITVVKRNGGTDMSSKQSIRDLLLRFNLCNKTYTKYRIHKTKEFMMSREDVKAAEADARSRHSLMQKYMSRWPARAKAVDDNISNILKKASSKETEAELQQYADDMRFCYFAYGFSPNEYLCYGLAAKNADERRSFVSERDIVECGYRMNDPLARQVLMDKMRTYERFKHFYGREAMSVCGESDHARYLDFVKKHPTFVKKDVMESCGRSVELVHLSEEGLSEEAFFHSLMNGRRYILEEQVVQSDAMSALNPSSVNTVRCLTIYTRHGILTPWCFLKVGQGGSFIDNGGAGGILVGIDAKTGVLSSDGIDELARRYAEHPDTGLTLKGYQLPEWENMLTMCREMASMEPQNKWIGWDMAHTAKGWVIIEGNSLSESIGPQSTSQHSIRSELEYYMKDVDLIV